MAKILRSIQLSGNCKVSVAKGITRVSVCVYVWCTANEGIGVARVGVWPAQKFELHCQ